MSTLNEDITVRNACITAIEAFKKLNKPEYSDIIARLEYCIASYDFDQNPIGLFENAELAYQMLIDAKQKDPRKISKKLLDDLKKSFSDGSL